MKKFLVCFLALSLLAGSVMAQEEDTGIGLTAGLEFGIYDLTEKDAEAGPDAEKQSYLMPILIYENAFLDGGFDVYAELNYTFGFTKVPKTPPSTDEVFPQILYFDLALGYNLGLGDTSTLSFLLENEVNDFMLSPRDSDSNNVENVILTPGVKFNQEISKLGALYVQAGVPVAYIQADKDADAEIGVDITLGWESTFGFGLSVKELNMVKTSGDKGYAGLEIVASYTNGPVYAEVEVDTPRKIDEDGLVIIPEFDYTFKDFTFYVNCEFAQIGIDETDATVSPAVGVKFSF